MFKIGCIGHAGRHGEIFCKLFNRDFIFPGYHISYMFGEDEVLTPEEKQKRFYGISEFCSSADELIEKSDAIMILTIAGESHRNYALKAIHAGKPVFVDKPFSTTYQDAKDMTDTALAKQVPLFGGSTLRHLKQIDEIKHLMRQTKFPFVSIAYRADPESPLGNYHYYASHISEICMALCGPDYKEVSVSRNQKNICSIVKYDSCTAVLMSTLDTELVNIHLLEKFSYSFDLNQDGCYIDGATKFVKMLETGIPPVPYEEFCSSVKLLQDISNKICMLK